MTQAKESPYLANMRRIKFLQRLLNLLYIGRFLMNRIQPLFWKGVEEGRRSSTRL
jgi:hypothetical protein